jgi:hypothetical protein
MEAVEVVEQELEGAEPQNTIRELGHRRWRPESILRRIRAESQITDWIPDCLPVRGSEEERDSGVEQDSAELDSEQMISVSV